MPSGEQTGKGSKKRSIPGSVRSEEEAAPPMSMNKVMAAFRIPRLIHAELTEEAQKEGCDLTAYVNRLFDGYLHYWGLPSVVGEGLDRDREKLGLSRHAYMQYLLFRRHEMVSKNGPGFDREPTKR